MMMEYLEVKFLGRTFFIGSKDNALVWADWEKPTGNLNEDNPFLLKVERELLEYLAGKRKAFKLKIMPEGTEFQKKVWKELLNIPWGKTVSYFDVAQAVGNPLGVRAVASAIGRNHIAIFIPCHRVISKSGSLGGYTGGTPIKKKLLKIEGHLF